MIQKVAYYTIKVGEQVTRKRASTLHATRLAASVCLLQCGGPAESTSGSICTMQVQNAVYHHGPLPEASTQGPEVTSVMLARSVRIGQAGHSCTGSLASDATAALLFLEGDPGHWILPAEPPAIESPTAPTFRAELAFRSTLSVGTHALWVAAVSGEGVAGRAVRTTITAQTASLGLGEKPDAAALVVTLRWSTDADLDLRVIEPGGSEIWRRDPRARATPEGEGAITVDANAACTRTHSPSESVQYTTRPPKGRYIARVDTFSMCRATTAPWTVEAWLHGSRIATAHGTATSFDTRFAHERGSGLTALEFDVP